MSVAERLQKVITRIDLLNRAEVRLRGGNHEATLWNHFRHSVEEVGEMARCLRGTNDEPIAHEAVDTAICALAIALLSTGGDVRPLLDVFDKKLDKWERKLEN